MMTEEPKHAEVPPPRAIPAGATPAPTPMTGIGDMEPTAPASRELQPDTRHVPPFNVLKARDDRIVWDMSKAKKKGDSAERLAKVITATTTKQYFA